MPAARLPEIFSANIEHRLNHISLRSDDISIAIFEQLEYAEAAEFLKYVDSNADDFTERLAEARFLRTSSIIIFQKKFNFFFWFCKG